MGWNGVAWRRDCLRFAPVPELKIVRLAKIKPPKLPRPLASTFQEDDLDKRNEKNPMDSRSEAGHDGMR